MGKISNELSHFPSDLIIELSEIIFPRPYISKFCGEVYLQTLLVWGPLGSQYVLHVRTLPNFYAASLATKAQIIHSCQSGYIKGRHMGQCIGMISDIMSFTEQKNVPGAAVFLDSEKAFDSIEWN